MTREKEYPVITFLTVVRFAGEHALVELRMQGDEVISRDVLDSGPLFSEIWDSFQAAAAERYGKKVVQ